MLDMLVNEMDISQTSSCERDFKKVLKFNASERTNFRNSHHSDKLLEDLQFLRRYIEGDFSCLLNKY